MEPWQVESLLLAPHNIANALGDIFAACMAIAVFTGGIWILSLRPR